MAAVTLPLFVPPPVPPAAGGGLAADSLPSPALPPVPPLRPGSRAFPMAAPETVHPALWRAHQLGRSRDQGLPSGFDALDAELPGHGWPRRVLTELLLAQHGIGELRLLAPALRRVMAEGRTVMLFDPPAPLCAPGWLQLGLDLRQLVLVQGRAGMRGRARELLPQADVLWALEQSLKSGHVGAVLGWLPARLRADALRRLQLAAQSHDGPVFLLRELAALSRPSPAPLRLALQSAGPDRLSVKLVKRRGPALAEPLKLMLPPVGMVPPPAGYGRSPPAGAGPTGFGRPGDMVPPPAGYGRSPPMGAGPTGFGRPGARGDPFRAVDPAGDVRTSSIEG